MDRNKEVRKGYTWNKIAIGFIRIVAGWIFCLISGFRCKHYRPKAKTWLLLANHTMNMDPLLDVIVLRRFMRFVASANLLRGFSGFFIKWLANPIPRYKGAPADDVVEAVKESLAAGVSVAMYPEGNVTWDGETGFISRRTAELVKECDGALITLRKIGGFFKTPRWAMKKRRGRTYAEVVGEYSREELDRMSVDEIYELIKRDLYLDAYEEQEKRHWKYSCDALAKGLEATLYVCPECGAVGDLTSEGDRFSCGCGAEWRFDDEGYLNPEKKGLGKASGIADVPADLAGSDGRVSILAWSRWQKKYLRDNAKRLQETVEEPICTDDGIRVYGDRLEIPNAIIENGPKEGGEYSVFRWDDISKLSLFRNTRVFFTWKGQMVEIHIDPSKENIGIRYYALWRICTGREYV